LRAGQSIEAATVITARAETLRAFVDAAERQALFDAARTKAGGRRPATCWPMRQRA